MKKALLLTVMLLSSITVLFAQATLSGKVVDAATQSPLDYVTIAIYPAGSDTPCGGGFSDIDGKFSYPLPYGKYKVIATYMGYETIEKTFDLNESHPHARTYFRLQEDAEVLETVEVTGKRSAMQLDIDKKVFRVDESIVTEGASATDILQNMPSVNVDTEGNVSMRNSNAVEIWINGKPSGMSDSDKGDLLEMIPAESIKTVELITNPSSKYNPEGSAGIINIVLKDNVQTTYLASVNAGLQYQEGAPYPGGNLGLNYTLNSKKVDFSLSANARSHKRESSGYTHRKSFAESDTTLLNQNNYSTRDRVNGFLKAALTFHLTEKDDFGVSGFGFYSRNWNRRDIHYVQTNALDDTLYIRDRNTYSQGDMGFYNATLDYTHRFVKDRNELYAAITYQGNQRTNTSHYANTYIVGATEPSKFQKQNQLGGANNLSAQIDYLYKFGKQNKIEAGGKAQWGLNTSNDTSLDSIAGGDGYDLTKVNLFNYREDIYALYASYGGQFNWFSLQVGVRGEETVTNANGHHRHYFNIFPSAYLSFALPKNNELQLNYTRRINRPRGRRINNYVDRTDPTDITFGNPDLLPEMTNSVEFNYLKVWDNHTLSAGLFYRYTEDVIQQLRTDSCGYMRTTYGNITFEQNAGVEVVAKNKLFHNYLDLTTTVSGYYYQLGGNDEYKIRRTETFSWQAKINANVKILDNLSGQLSANYEAPRLVAQGSISHQYAMDLGLKASFLKKSLSLSFSVRDVLNSRSRTHRTSYGDGFEQESASTHVGRTYRLNISYNFGNLSGKKGKKGNRNNDDGVDFDEEF